MAQLADQKATVSEQMVQAGVFPLASFIAFCLLFVVMPATVYMAQLADQKATVSEQVMQAGGPSSCFLLFLQQPSC